MLASHQPSHLSLEELLKRASVEKDGEKLGELIAEIYERYEERNRNKSQSNYFTIFRGVPDGQPEWVETVVGLTPANERMTQIAAGEPGPYFVFHAATGTVVSRFNNEPGESDPEDYGNSA